MQSIRHLSCRLKYAALLLFAFLSLPALADIEIGYGVSLGDDLASLTSKLEDTCSAIEVYQIDPPGFPLAENREAHLICKNYARNGIAFESSAFTLADDRFVRMEAIGVNHESVEETLGESEVNYLDFRVYANGSLWWSASRRTLVWINDDGLHPNLFAWRNPLLRDTDYTDLKQSTVLPAVLNFTATFNAQRDSLEDSCTPLLVESIEEVWLPNVPDEQLQANCFNLHFAGFDRKFEFVYGDGDLEVVWVLTAELEERRVRGLLQADWGPASISNEVWEVFGQGRISLRKDRPEILILSDEMIPLYLEEFENPTPAPD